VYVILGNILKASIKRFQMISRAYGNDWEINWCPLHDNNWVRVVGPSTKKDLCTFLKKYIRKGSKEECSQP
jgi:hypothetical protein